MEKLIKEKLGSLWTVTEPQVQPTFIPDLSLSLQSVESTTCCITYSSTPLFLSKFAGVCVCLCVCVWEWLIGDSRRRLWGATWHVAPSVSQSRWHRTHHSWWETREGCSTVCHKQGSGVQWMGRGPAVGELDGQPGKIQLFVKPHTIKRKTSRWYSEPQPLFSLTPNKKYIHLGPK